MNTSEVLQMIETLKETGFNHIDVSHEGTHILLSNAEFAGANLMSNQEMKAAPIVKAQVVQQVHQTSESSNVVMQSDSAVESQEDAAPMTGGHIVESPIVGTFYTAAGPDSDDFVSVGSKVNKGDVLCIIEAMKLMNEIEADKSGEIAEILVANEDGVEYGQPLFRIV